MASTSRPNHLEEDDDAEEEVQHFADFTLASSWERFISDIEANCRQWLADGPKNLVEKGAVAMEDSKNLFKVKNDLRSVTQSYCMEFYFQIDDNGSQQAGFGDWNSGSHDLQLCFGVKDFLLIAPQSASGVLLDAPESSKLLSAVAIALSNCASLWPVFVPVHDPSRKAYIGIQNMGTVFTRRFEADLIGSQVPMKLMHLEGLYELFVSKFVYSGVDFSMHNFKVHFMMRLKYQTFTSDEEDEESDMDEYMGDKADTEEHNGSESRNKVNWDDDCPWNEWYSAEDPLKGFELVATWADRTVENTLEMAELENDSPHEAEKWILRPILSPYLGEPSHGKRIDFASQLLCLVEALDVSFIAQFMEDFVSVENQSSESLKTSVVIPPPTALDRVIKDLFHQGFKLPDFTKGEHRLSRALKAAPLESLFTQFCLHSLWFGNCNIRAIAFLWVEFVREVRWCWEESQPLPKMPIDGSIDLSTCLINQKLHLLAICIEKKCEMNEEFLDCIGSEEDSSEASDPIEEHHKVDETRNASSEEYLLRKRDSSITEDSSDRLRYEMDTETTNRNLVFFFFTSKKDMVFKVSLVSTSPIDGQKPGTSGLRKKVKVFKQPNYLQNFVQSTFNALTPEKVKGATLVVSGDGRYYSNDAVQIIIKMAAANGVRRVWVGKNTLLSTPAVSALIRERSGADGSKATGGFILTASHNPGGPTEDFGIKYNMENGGPAPESITDKIYENTKTIKEYPIAEDLPIVDISAIGVSSFEGPEGKFDVEVFDSADDYVKLMKSIFDFESIRKLLSSPKFSFCYDAMHGVAGAYAHRIFVEELGAQESSLLNCVPKEDFGGGHPDPNLTYAKELVARMGLGKSDTGVEPPEFGAAADGDADRNMILGKRFFVTPSDSVAIIAANAVGAIPYFSTGLKGVARSMPTSAALDVVAKSLNLKFFEVPTGWKFFGNLMDAGMCSVCGEESFGTGSDHIREKDGIWAVLAWLSILAHKNKETLDGDAKLVTVEDIVRKHWATYGRHYYTRYDYENVDAGKAKELMEHLVILQSSIPEVNKMVKGIRSDVANVSSADEFEYKDPVDGSISKHQGIRYLFEDGSRLVFRLSGTGSEGATIRLYIEQYEKDASKTGRESHEALSPLVDIALKLSKMEEFTGRSAPTVIT